MQGKDISSKHHIRSREGIERFRESSLWYLGHPFPCQIELELFFALPSDVEMHAIKFRQCTFSKQPTSIFACKSHISACLEIQIVFILFRSSLRRSFHENYLASLRINHLFLVNHQKLLQSNVSSAFQTSVRLTPPTLNPF